eukprot:TRINITY_DN5584_c0_g1_i2.p1 TRINITY_DN5584_c0_g1~~TRINITY_DN5584_c0_g1_i2.p1  ORF type:complete len:118 (+),score=30.77 TRINITY_DN5584_c0_g1_i2:52-405(+)
MSENVTIPMNGGGASPQDQEEERLRAKLLEDEDTCWKMFVGGIFALPWLWFVNAFWFRSALFGGPSHLMTTYTRFSLIGSIMYGVALFAWLGVFQDNWQDWDEKGEDLAIIIPKGDP